MGGGIRPDDYNITGGVVRKIILVYPELQGRGAHSEHLKWLRNLWITPNVNIFQTISCSNPISAFSHCVGGDKQDINDRSASIEHFLNTKGLLTSWCIWMTNAHAPNQSLYFVQRKSPVVVIVDLVMELLKEFLESSNINGLSYVSTSKVTKD